ncbi:manganese/iron ABC transporter ATP-binding protein [Moritella yayanosii]|uniref:Putative iron transport system ATP-binding protein HI_0361 n=1 Tax=Moritella yayanosii TaxID=69539 RepID=A0A330LMG1_9GAMM|nr:manganese/iron ABC transporter ATP-binding protein [Moritella yayanosii]SQD78040.1 putative iron transport system ATP-binding protein HI_0361 [Moritella yayanosii]
MMGLEVNDISVTYRNGHTALYNASFSLPKGSITALVGINGSGKSTLFKAIMGFVTLAKGSVNILGMPVKKALKSNLVAYVPQSEEIDWNFPILVEDVVMMGRYGHMNMLRIAKPNDHDKVNMALDRVSMGEFKHRQIGELSGGQKKRVFLARALAQESQVILLDEPFTGVDVKTEEQIMALLRELRGEGKVILVSTHNLGSVPEFCDRTVLINRTILDAGLTKDVFTQDNLQKTFGGVLRHFILAGDELHEDDDRRQVTVLSDHERPVVLYGESEQKPVVRERC